MDQISYETALLWVFLLPLLGALINGLLGRNADRSLVGGIAVGSVGAAFALAALCAVRIFLLRAGGEAHPQIVSEVYTWLAVGPMPIDVRFVLDPLSAVMTLVVTGIATLIHVFSLGYMSEEKSWSRYFAYLNLFTASMLLLVLASSMPVLFVGWEGVGVCSYLLIGFWHEDGKFSDAAKKAFIVNRIGDFGVITGMLILASKAGSFEMSAINAAATGIGLEPFIANSTLTLTCVTAGALLLFLGCCGKSAQLPLYVWLPDAMAGPTPVSALIHAATMVTAGVYLCCRLSSVFLASPTTLSVIAVIGALTAIIGACSALVQNDLKKILAYSTVSQLGFMFAAIGVGAFTAGIFHVVTHAFFKACLFLGAGSIMHAVHAHGDADIRLLGGLADKLPRTRATFLISVLAIAGVPLTSGFFSKDEILAGAASTGLYTMGADSTRGIIGWIVFGVLVLSAVLTAFYMFRAYAMIFRGTYRGAGEYDESPHESAPVLTVPLVILALGALLVGFIGIPHAWHLPNLLGHLLEGTVKNAEFDNATSLPAIIALAGGLLAAALGLGAAHFAYPGDASDPVERMPEGLRAFFMESFRVDALYARYVVRPVHGLSAFAAAVDRAFIDFAIVQLPSLAVRELSKLSVRLQDGVVHTYALAMTLGLTGLVTFFVYPHSEIRAVVTREKVTLSTDPGLGYRYRWDVDGDSSGDRNWESDLVPGLTEIEAHYTAADYVGVQVLSRPAGFPDSVLRIGRTPRELTRADLGEAPFRNAERADARPVVWVEGTSLHILANAFPVTVNGRPAGREEVVAGPDAEVRIGNATLLVLPVVRVKLEIETAFGQRVKRSILLPLMQESMREDISVLQMEAYDAERAHP